MKRKYQIWKDEETFMEALKETARTYGRTEDKNTLAKKYDIERPALVQQWAVKLRRLGVDIPRLRMTNNCILKAVEELKEENPELFEKRVIIRHYQKRKK